MTGSLEKTRARKGPLVVKTFKDAYLLRHDDKCRMDGRNTRSQLIRSLADQNKSKDESAKRLIVIKRSEAAALMASSSEVLFDYQELGSWTVRPRLSLQVLQRQEWQVWQRAAVLFSRISQSRDFLEQGKEPRSR